MTHPTMYFVKNVKVLSEGYFTLKLEGPWSVIHKLCELIEKPEIIQVKLELKGPKGPKKIWVGEQVDNVSWYTR